MAISKSKKEEIVQEITEKIKENKMIVFSDYRGLSVEEINDVRKQLKQKGVELKVIKQNLFKIAAKSAKADIDMSDFKDHPIAFAFGQDEVDPAKIIYNYSKKHEALEMIGGIIDGKQISLDELKTLAIMSSKDEMYTKIVGSISAPLSGLVFVLGGNLRGLISVLNQYSKQRSAISDQ